MRFLFAFFLLLGIFLSVGVQAMEDEVVTYSGEYEVHYTATLPTNLSVEDDFASEKGCNIDTSKGLKLYQYRYYTTIPYSLLLASRFFCKITGRKSNSSKEIQICNSSKEIPNLSKKLL